MYKKVLMALSCNDFIEEISLSRTLNSHRCITGCSNFPFYEISKLFSKRSLKVVNFDCRNHFQLDKVLQSIFLTENMLSLQVKRIRILNANLSDLQVHYTAVFAHCEYKRLKEPLQIEICDTKGIGILQFMIRNGTMCHGAVAGYDRTKFYLMEDG